MTMKNGMWRRVDPVKWTDVSEGRIASVFRVEKSASEEPAWAGSSRLLLFAHDNCSLADSSILKTEAKRSSETLVHFTRSTRRHIPEDGILHCLADNGGRSVWGMNCLRPLEHWGRGFESQLRNGCLCAFILYLCCPVCRQRAFRRADPPPKEPYLLCIGLRNWKSSQGTTKGCRAIDKWMVTFDVTDISAIHSIPVSMRLHTLDCSKSGYASIRTRWRIFGLHMLGRMMN
jgi:hypothetical protein